MIIGAGPNLRPHVADVDTPKAAGRIPMQRRPAETTKIVKPLFDYEQFFGVMELIELDQSMFDQLPHIEEQRTVPGSERVNALLTYNQATVKELIKRVGGIPLRLVSEEGEGIHGRVTELHDFTAGKWGISFHSKEADEVPKIYHSTQELREGYLAATALTTELEPTE